jgi:lipoate-protein ligase A
MIPIHQYNLPDISILENTGDAYHIWHPQDTYIVLGAGNKPEESLIEEHVLADQIAVHKRPSGGQTVVLTPKTLVVSVLLHQHPTANPLEAFKKINTTIASALARVGVEKLAHKGISDITIEDRKILGSSIYRSKERLFYHGVLNVAEPSTTFERYLKHPPKEPDYRRGRPHGDFVTSIATNKNDIDIRDIEQSLHDAMRELMESLSNPKKEGAPNY